MIRDWSSIKKAELVERVNYRCGHGKTGITHPNCFDKQYKQEEVIGYLDIECSNLAADFGIVLSYCIKYDKGDVIKNVITPKEIKNGTFDKRLMQDLCRDIRKFNRIITFYGRRFDIPFLRTRCIYHKLDFPFHKEVYHTDAYFIARYKLRMHSNRLGVVAPFFGIKAKEHPLNGEVWLKCLSGDKKALAYTLTHNEEDVVSLEKFWQRVQNYAQIRKTGI